MVGVQINPIAGLPSGFSELLKFVVDHIEDRNVEALLEGLLEGRQGLRPLLSKSKERLKDLIFLDIALDSTLRMAMERGYGELNNVGPEVIMHFITLVLENLALSSDHNEDLESGDCKVLVTKAADKMKVYLATNFQESLILHWALSKSVGEWLAPHSSELPIGSVSLEKAIDTPFAHAFVDSPYELQMIEIDIKADTYAGMLFVLFSDGKWIKNNGSDFYVEFVVRSKDPQKDSGDVE